MTHTGWRKPTPGLVQAERFAQAGERLAVPKSQAIVAVKKVAAAIGLKSQDLLLLDTFGAVTQPQDWEQGRRPIVWASNHFLMEQTGFSLATLRRHVRRLCEVGVISMKDSPNGKRWGRRDEDGVIVEAYGFDLSPLAARAQEFEALYAELQSERAECATLRNAITIARRVIRAKIEKALETGLRGPWRDLQEDYRELLDALPTRSERVGRLEVFLEQIKTLLTSVEQAFEAAFDLSKNSDAEQVSDTIVSEATSRNMTPSSTENETHILTTNEPNPVKSNRFETKPAASVAPQIEATAPVETAEDVDLDINWSTHGKSRGSDVDIPMLMASCPHFAEMARGTQGYLRDWNDVHRAAAKLRPIVGISEDAWNVANRVLGPAVAAASIALIIDKSTNGEIKSPGGYLRGMVEKAGAGELHLERSFYGRLSGQAA
ncbi:plasmid replication protein RepC [Litoreibacter roseus]|uniref:Putative replication protein C n=1 Tax=Litoreibacter roseus TaxID=2601869 RepID=A0A6N6JNS1_9RHOB|nr:plasmid replication protein RepC [Litoreibacter roseus]GFE67259.1 putative replication protein C [Litoreibacter roseus]